eukprot:PhF_6_TR31101/c0_g1_i2/m.45494
MNNFGFLIRRLMYPSYPPVQEIPQVLVDLTDLGIHVMTSHQSLIRALEANVQSVKSNQIALAILCLAQFPDDRVFLSPCITHLFNHFQASKVSIDECIYVLKSLTKTYEPMLMGSPRFPMLVNHLLNVRDKFDEIQYCNVIESLSRMHKHSAVSSWIPLIEGCVKDVHPNRLNPSRALNLAHSLVRLQEASGVKMGLYLDSLLFRLELEEKLSTVGMAELCWLLNVMLKTKNVKRQELLRKIVQRSCALQEYTKLETKHIGFVCFVVSKLCTEANLKSMTRELTQLVNVAYSRLYECSVKILLGCISILSRVDTNNPALNVMLGKVLKDSSRLTIDQVHTLLHAMITQKPSVSSIAIVTNRLRDLTLKATSYDVTMCLQCIVRARWSDVDGCLEALLTRIREIIPDMTFPLSANVALSLVQLRTTPFGKTKSIFWTCATEISEHLNSLLQDPTCRPTANHICNVLRLLRIAHTNKNHSTVTSLAPHIHREVTKMAPQVLTEVLSTLVQLNYDRLGLTIEDLVVEV